MAAKDLLAEERRELERKDTEAIYRRMSNAELTRVFIEDFAGMLDKDGKLSLEARMILAGEPCNWTPNEIDVFERVLPDLFGH